MKEQGESDVSQCFKIGQIQFKDIVAEGFWKGGSLDAPKSLQDVNRKTGSPGVRCRQPSRDHEGDFQRQSGEIGKKSSFLDKIEPPTLHHLSVKRPLHSC